MRPQVLLLNLLLLAQDFLDIVLRLLFDLLHQGIDLEGDLLHLKNRVSIQILDLLLLLQQRGYSLHLGALHQAVRLVAIPTQVRIILGKATIVISEPVGGYRHMLKSVR